MHPMKRACAWLIAFTPVCGPMTTFKFFDTAMFF